MITNDEVKVFISQPMKGKTDKEILEERNRAVDQIKTLFTKDKELIVLDSFVFEDAPKSSNEGLWYLSKSISVLSESDIAVFLPGWESARGCIIEHLCADTYGIKTMCL